MIKFGIARVRRAAAVLLVFAALINAGTAFAGETDDFAGETSWIPVGNGRLIVDNLNGVPAYAEPFGYYGCSEFAVRYYKNVYGVSVSVGYTKPSSSQAETTFRGETLKLAGFGEAGTPKPGDIVHWHADIRNKSYSHTAMVKSYSGGVITLVEQNWMWNGGAVYERRVTYPSKYYTVSSLYYYDAAGNRAQITDLPVLPVTYDFSQDDRFYSSVNLKAPQHPTPEESAILAAAASPAAPESDASGDTGVPLNASVPAMAAPEPANLGFTGTSSPALFALGNGGTDAAPVDATLSTHRVTIDGFEMQLEGYNIAGSNYYKLRDVAYAMNGTAGQFNVGWNGETSTVNLTRGQAYASVGGEMAPPSGTQKTALQMKNNFTVDGMVVNITAYSIDNSNFFKLRDIGAIAGFDVGWDKESETVEIRTAGSYVSW